jgi:hypothetical protein
MSPPRHYESAQEEFQRRVRELYELADKMGLRLTVTVKKKPASAPNSGAMARPSREPGEN